MNSFVKYWDTLFYFIILWLLQQDMITWIDKKGESEKKDLSSKKKSDRKLCIIKSWSRSLTNKVEED